MEVELLKTLGLSDNEIKIYLYLLQEKVQSVKQVSTQVNLNRTTTYRYLETLIDKGLVEWVIDELGGKVQLTSLDALELLAREQKQKSLQTYENLEKLLPHLEQIRPVKQLETQVRYYKGEKSVQQMIWNTLKTKEIMRGYVPFRRREFIDPHFEEEFEEEWAQRKLIDRVITNENRMDYITKLLNKEYRKTVEIRIIPEKEYYVTSDICIYNNIFSIISFEENNVVGVEIENAEMVKTQKSIFDIVWEVAKPLEYLV